MLGVFFVSNRTIYFLRNSDFDAEAISDACNIFVGIKDFKALSKKSRHSNGREVSTIRHIESLKLEPASPLLPNSQLAEEYDFWHFQCSGTSFVYHQVISLCIV